MVATYAASYLTKLPESHGPYAVWYTLGGQNTLKHFSGLRALTLEAAQVTNVELSCREDMCQCKCKYVCVCERERQGGRKRERERERERGRDMGIMVALFVYSQSSLWISHP